MNITANIMTLLVLALLAGCGVAEEEAKPAEMPAAPEITEMDEAAESPAEPEAVETTEVAEPVQLTELQIMVGKYEAAVVEKLAELEQIEAKVKEIPVGKIVDEQTEALKKALDEIAVHLGKMKAEAAARLGEMKDELAVYIEEVTAEKESPAVEE